MATLTGNARKVPFGVWAAAFVLLVLFTACAYTGSTTADGEGSTGIEGSPDAEIRATISLGETTVHAAAEAVRSYIAAQPSPLTKLQQDEAVNAGVNAGLAEAKERGYEVTPEQEDELRQYVRGLVRENHPEP